MKAEKLSLRHTTIVNMGFTFSSCKDEEESLCVAYDFTRKLFIGVCKRSEAYDNRKYDITEIPFSCSERQLDSVVLPQIAQMTKGLVIAEYPVDRHSKGKQAEAYDSKGRIDYWCIYKGYSFAIEMKHGYDEFMIESTREISLKRRWRKMNDGQLKDIKEDILQWEESTKGIIRLGLHFITPYKAYQQSVEKDYEYFRENQKDILTRLYKDVRPTPDFLASWLMKEKLSWLTMVVKPFQD